MIKTVSLLTAFSLLTGASLAAADAKDELTAAAKALAEKPNYTWKTTVAVPPDAQFKPGPTDGKIEKDGCMVVATTGFQGNTQQTIKRGEKIALTNREGGWDSIAEVEANTEGFGRFQGTAARSLKAPAAQALELVQQVKELKKDGDTYAGKLTEEAARAMMTQGGRGGRGGGGGQSPNILVANASAKFWVKDGVLVRFEYKIDGSMERNGNEIEVIRTTTTEIKDVGTTKVEVPAAAQAKLN